MAEITFEQYKSLREKGLSPERINQFINNYSIEEIQREEARKKEGFLSSVGRSIITPVAKMLARPIQATQALFGKSAEEIDISTRKALPYFGRDLATPKSGKDVLKDVGAGLETISLGIGGGGAVSTVKTGLKGLIKAGATEGLKTGLKSGAVMSFGQSLQDATNQKPEDAFKTIFMTTALGTIFSGIGGGILGSATPLIAKSVSGTKKFLNLQDLENKLSNSFKKILNPTSRQIKIDSRFGNDSFKFLAKEAPDLPLTVNADGRVILDDAIEMAKTKYQAEATAYKPIIKNSGKFVDLDDVLSDIKMSLKNEFDGTDLIRAEKQVEDELNAFVTSKPDSIIKSSSGKRFMALDRADDVKTYSWGRGKGWGTPEAEVWNDTNNIIGHSFKDAIEKQLPEAPIRAMNKRLGQWKNAIDLLEKRNMQVSGSGGKLSKYIIRSTGTLLGGSLGGKQGDGTSIGGLLGGASAGYLTANTLAMILANPNVRLFVVRQLLKRLQKTGQGSLIKEAEQILQEQSSKYLLPASGQSSFKESIINLPKSIRETNLGLDEVRNAQIAQRAINSQIAQPINAPSTIPKNEIISKTIPNTKKKATLNKKGGKINVPLTAAGATGAGLAVASQIGGEFATYKREEPNEVTNKPIELNPQDSKVIKLDSGIELRQVPDNIKPIISNIYSENPNLPKGIIETILFQESSMGTNNNNKNPKIGEYAWLGGLTDIAKQRLIDEGKSVDFDSVQGVIKAIADYLSIVRERHNSKGEVTNTITDPLDLYMNYYKTSSGKQFTDKNKKIFNEALKYYANE